MKKTDEEILKLVGGNVPLPIDLRLFGMRGYRLCEQEKDAEIESLRTDNANFSAEIEKYMDEAVQMRAEIERLKNDVVSLEENRDELTRVVELYLDTNVKLRSEKEALEAQFKNFHRSLCERFGYTHDEIGWKRDQISLEEHINSKIEALEARMKGMVEGLKNVQDALQFNMPYVPETMLGPDFSQLDREKVFNLLCDYRDNIESLIAKGGKP